MISDKLINMALNMLDDYFERREDVNEDDNGLQGNVPNEEMMLRQCVITLRCHINQLQEELDAAHRLNQGLDEQLAALDTHNQETS